MFVYFKTYFRNKPLRIKMKNLKFLIDETKEKNCIQEQET